MVQYTTKADEFESEKRRTSALCWAARIVPLIVVIPLVPWMFYVLVFTYRNDAPPFLAEAAFLSPIVSALIAWKWHLVGGALLSALAILVIVVPMVLTGFDFLLTLFGTVLLAGGILHLIVWWQERRMQKPQRT
jgi:hypothetical protein